MWVEHTSHHDASTTDMSFRVGDFLVVTKLAWKVYTAYKDYKDAPEDFRNISDEFKSLHIIADRHKDKFQNSTLNTDEAAQLREILQGCKNVLEDLDRLRINYMSLGSAPGSSSQAVDRTKWSQENIAELRARPSSNTTLLTSFKVNSHDRYGLYLQKLIPEYYSGIHAEINRTHASRGTPRTSRAARLDGRNEKPFPQWSPPQKFNLVLALDSFIRPQFKHKGSNEVALQRGGIGRETKRQKRRSDSKNYFNVI